MAYSLLAVFLLPLLTLIIADSTQDETEIIAGIHSFTLPGWLIRSVEKMHIYIHSDVPTV
jgi:hypothetical protein